MSTASTARVATLAERLDSAAFNATATPQLEDPITLDEAYAVQRESIARRLARGETRVGIKMGFTSRAKMVQMGVSDLIWGWSRTAAASRSPTTCIRASSRRSRS
jgi:2-keto-4-pentenoate hydratase